MGDMAVRAPVILQLLVTRRASLRLLVFQDFSLNSTRGPTARKRGVGRTAREMIEQLCKVDSPMFAHLPEMYTVAECVDGHVSDFQSRPDMTERCDVQAFFLTDGLCRIHKTLRRLSDLL